MRRAAALAVVIVAHAVVQAACVLPGATPAVAPGFLGLLAASAGTSVVAATAVLVLVGSPGPLRPRALRALVAVLVSLLIVGLLTVLSTAAGMIALVVAIVVASPTGNADAGPFDGLRAFVRHPVRAGLLILATAAGVAASAISAVLLGLFVTGAFGAFATWAVSGTVIALVVGGWARLARRQREFVDRIRPLD